MAGRVHVLFGFVMKVIPSVWRLNISMETNIIKFIKVMPFHITDSFKSSVRMVNHRKTRVWFTLIFGGNIIEKLLELHTELSVFLKEHLHPLVVLLEDTHWVEGFA